MKKSLSLMICMALILTGCQTVTESSETVASTETSEASETSDTPVTESLTSATDQTTDTQVMPDLHHDYIPSGEGYFSLFDIGYGTQIKAQVAGTCWAYATSTCIESTYKKDHDRDITINPISIVDLVYHRDKDEGFMLKDGITRLDAGGTQEQVIFEGTDGMADGFTVIEARTYDEDDRDEIKNAIRNEGAVVIGIADNDSHIQYIDNYTTLRDTDNTDDHCVVLVGWDDNFPKEYFVEEAPENGAWLAQNSFGGAGNMALYWISYDTSLFGAAHIEVSDEYSCVASYDCGMFDEISTGDKTCVANVFHQAGQLSAVGFYIPAEDQHVTVHVLDGQFGDELATVERTFEYIGYYILELPSALTVDDYTIVAEYSGKAPVEGSPDYEDETLSIVCTSHPGESFVKVNGQWLDMNDPDTAAAVGHDGILNNCCLKGLYSAAQ
ncbi:Cysteine protease, C1A family [Ruminococcaceae bacterium YRB3002]|nr:Cysteine protease, C1A family [Ruminococcaceae bacterium YRB3002]